MNTLYPSSVAAIIGIDWADQKHDICLKIIGSETVEFSVLMHKPEIIDAWANALRTRFPGKPLVVCLEQRKGALIHALMKYDFLHLVPINPQTVARYRRTFTPSRAKDDPRDAQILVELVEKHPDKLQPWKPGSTAIRRLQQMVEMRRRLVADKVRLTNRITACLKAYYPQPLNWFNDTDTDLFCDFLARWPNLKQVQRARETTLLAFFNAHHAHYPKVNARRIKAINCAVPLTQDDGVIQPNQLLLQTLVQQLKTTLSGIKTFDTAVTDCFTQHPDASLFTALPGAGQHYAPRLLATFGDDRARFSQAQDLLQYTGIAPVTERSGKKSWVHWRYNCPKFLRQSVIEWANESIRHSFWARSYYQQQKAKGCSHQIAVRALAFKWIRILFRCWQDRKPYDESTYLLALKRKHSPLLENLATG